MKVEQLSTQILSNLKSVSEFNFKIHNELTPGIKIGDHLQGRVVESYGSGRYLINFNGIEKNVESIIPFTVDEIIHGRVVGVGDKVELQRIRLENEIQKANNNQEGLNHSLFISNAEKIVNSLFGKYNSTLNQADKSLLVKQVNISQNQDLMALSGLLLKKIGLPQSVNLLNEVYRVLSNPKHAIQISKQIKSIPELIAQNHSVDVSEENQLHIISDLLRKHSSQDIEDMKSDFLNMISASEAKPSKVSKLNEQEDSDNASKDGNEKMDLMNYLFNSQIEGAVSHRVFSLPLQFGDELVKLDIAIFEQKKKFVTEQGIRYRQIVFSLNTDALGNVQIKMNIADRNLRLQVFTDDHENTNLLAEYVNDIKSLLSEFEWNVDEVSYGTKIKDETGEVLRSVVEQYVNQDSLSRLV